MKTYINYFTGGKKVNTAQNGKSSEYMTALNDLVTEAHRVLGGKADKFIEALNQALSNRGSKARLAGLEGDVVNLRLHRFPAVMQALSRLIMHSNDGTTISPKIQEARDALTHFLAAELKEISPDYEMINRARRAINILTD
jgi:hypothetical protein